MVDVKVGAAPGPRSVAAWLASWTAAIDEPDVTFVLPKEPLHASALVLLAATAASRRASGLASRAAGDPASNPVAQLVLRTEAATQGRGPRGELAILQPIRTLRTAREVADRAADALAEAAPRLSPSIARLARFVFEELGANVVQHSGRPETGYGFAAIDPDRGRLELAFADAGIGFHASLQRHPELEGRVADDAEALQLALSPRITGSTQPRTNMGMGLKQLSDFSDLLGADLWIASGAALLHRRTTAGQRAQTLASIPPWRGSWISFDGPIG